MSGNLNGRGWLGVLLMRSGLGYNEANEMLDYLECYAKKLGYVITVEKVDDPQA